MPSRLSKKPSVFLSYVREDRQYAEQLYQDLVNAGFAPWIDLKNILPGEDWNRTINAAIESADFFLALLSNNSVNKRGFVHVEVKRALEEWQLLPEGHIYFIPVRLEQCEVPFRLRQFQWVDLFEPDGLEQLLKALSVGAERLNLIQGHFDILEKGVNIWNNWRRLNPDVKPDLFNKDLSHMNLSGVNFSYTNLSKTDLVGVDFRKADLKFANCKVADFRNSDLGGADLRGADLTAAIFIDTNFQGADLSDCKIYGIAAWDVNLDNATQNNLCLSREGEPVITVDNIEVAQFIYLLLRNEKVRRIIDTITSKVVLILGRFTPERKVVLDALREELRRRDFLPILFDFEEPSSRNLTETISTLAHMSRFIIADITDAKSIPQELQRVVPDLPSLPVQPIILSSQYEYGMFKDFLYYDWVLKPFRYDGLKDLLSSLDQKVIAPVTSKAKEIEERRKRIEAEIAKR